MEHIGHHITSKGVLRAYLALIGLGVLMVLASRIDVSMLRATLPGFVDAGAIRIGLIMLPSAGMAVIMFSFFMGLRNDTPLNRTVFLASFVFLLLFLVVTVADMATRGDIETIHTERVNWQSPVRPVAPGELSEPIGAGQPPAGGSAVQPAEPGAEAAVPTEPIGRGLTTPGTDAQGMEPEMDEATRARRDSALQEALPGPNGQQPAPAE